jgi:ribokinase
MKVANEAKGLGKTVVFDPAPVQVLPLEAYANIDYLIPNETEASVLAGFPVENPTTARDAAVLLRSKGVQTVIIKMGAQGVSFATDGDQGHLPAFSVKVVDTVAAGDAFNGAFSVAIAEGRSLRDAITWGMAAGALAVTNRGAHTSMPSREDVERLILEQHR